MNKVTALFFATLRDRMGIKSVELQIPLQTNVTGFRNLLIEKYPVLSELMNHTLVSINHEYAFDEAIIPDDAEIALFPPVSGG
ncbi:MAG: MoaD/ThiS family protein [Chloroflexi bacterium]|nr:MoaD/ThiS family protein [Chloroflexota bacterium]